MGFTLALIDQCVCSIKFSKIIFVDVLEFTSYLWTLEEVEYSFPFFSEGFVNASFRLYAATLYARLDNLHCKGCIGKRLTHFPKPVLELRLLGKAI